MNLLIDIGNSRLKWALWNDGVLGQSKAMAHDSRLASDTFDSAWGALPRPERVVVSNVMGNRIAAELRQWVTQRWQLKVEYLGSTKQAAGITNGYRDVAQLGVDRWAAIVAAYCMIGEACLVVDCGSATTLDVIDNDGCHRGGLIIPGVRLMMHSLTMNTEQISIISLSNKTSGLGQSTAEAITLGVVESAVALVASTRRKWASATGGEIEIIITGGDAATMLDAAHFPCRHAPDLVLQGVAILGGMASEGRPK
jgi:type III pantothenate kinase